jgi:hypothetical protein
LFLGVNCEIARFNSTENSQEENLIVTSNGQFVVAWDFAKAKRGKLDKYEIKWYGSPDIWFWEL